jgi:hypothetical protein
MRERFQRAELARRTGCNLETVRYYEKVGLLPEPPRTARAKIGDLRRMEAALSEAIARCGDGARPDCPLIEALSRDENMASAL